MCILLFRYLYKSFRNRDKPHRPKSLNENQQPNKVPLRENQLDATNGTNSNGVLNEKASTDPIPEEDSSTHRESIAEKNRARAYRWKLILSLLIPNMMASMDLTITATALPIIASHFSRCSE